MGDALKDEEEGSLNSTGPASVREGWGFCLGFVCFRKIINLFVNKERETFSTENTCHLGISVVS